MSASPEKKSPTARSGSPAARVSRSSKPARPRDKQILYRAGPNPDVLAPMIDIEVIGLDGTRWQDAALIDSGADRSAFPLHWLRRLKIRKTVDCHQRTFDGAGGRGRQWVYESGVRAVIEDREIRLAGCFVNSPVILLGREDFLCKFEVRLDQQNARYFLCPYSKGP